MNIFIKNHLNMNKYELQTITYVCIYEILSDTPDTKAVPLKIQKSAGKALSRSIDKIKLEECPVVDKTPDLAWVLYRGASYLSLILSLRQGINLIAGSLEYKTPILASHKPPADFCHSAASTNMP